MATDQLGRVAKLHARHRQARELIHQMRVADISKLKSEDPDCLMLAAIFSQLVDFGKTGRAPADLIGKIRNITKRVNGATNKRLPDFMTSESVLSGQKPWANFYESPVRRRCFRALTSQNALGVLFRAISLGDCFGPLVYAAAGSASITDQSAAAANPPVLRPRTPSPAPSPATIDDHWTTLLEILDDKLIQIGVNTADFDAARHGRCAEILRSYTSDVATACHAHALQHGDKLIEEEVRRFVLGRESCSGPSPGLSCIAVQVRSH